MTTTTNLETALHAALPSPLHPHVPDLARVLVDALEGNAPMITDESLLPLVEALQNTAISLGDQRLSVQATAGDQTNAPHSQGFINRPTGPVLQVFVTPQPSPPTPTPTPLPAPCCSLANPFGRTGRIVNPAEFFDREPLLERIFGELGKGCSLSLIGERQVGKSSLLAMVAAHGPQRLGLDADAFLSIDMQIIHDENDFYEALCEALGTETCRGFRLARRLRGKRYILCLDEIEKMGKERFSGDEREELRGLADGEDAPLTLVVASSLPLERLFPDVEGRTSPLANICPPITVPRFSPDVARAFLAARLAGTGVCFSESQLDRLIEASSGHPAQLQHAAAELYRLLTE